MFKLSKIFQINLNGFSVATTFVKVMIGHGLKLLSTVVGK